MKPTLAIAAIGALLACALFLFKEQPPANQAALIPRPPALALVPTVFASPSRPAELQAPLPPQAEPTSARTLIPEAAPEPELPPFAAGLTLNSLGIPVPGVRLEVIPTHHQKAPAQAFATSDEDGAFRFPPAPGVADFRLRFASGKNTHMSPIFKAGANNLIVTVPLFTTLEGTFKQTPGAQQTWLLLAVPEGTRVPSDSQKIKSHLGSHINKSASTRFSFDRIAQGYYDLHIYSTYTRELLLSILAIEVFTPRVENPNPPVPSYSPTPYHRAATPYVHSFHDLRLADIDPTVYLPKLSLTVALADGEPDTSVIIQQLFESADSKTWLPHVYGTTGRFELPMLTPTMHLSIAATGYLPQELIDIDSDQTVVLQKGISASIAITDPQLPDNAITVLHLYSESDDDGPVKARSAVPTIRLHGNNQASILVGSPGRYRIVSQFTWPISEATGTAGLETSRFFDPQGIIDPEFVDILTDGQQVDLSLIKEPR